MSIQFGHKQNVPCSSTIRSSNDGRDTLVITSFATRIHANYGQTVRDIFMLGRRGHTHPAISRPKRRESFKYLQSQPAADLWIPGNSGLSSCNVRNYVVLGQLEDRESAPTNVDARRRNLARHLVQSIIEILVDDLPLGTHLDGCFEFLAADLHFIVDDTVLEVVPRGLASILTSRDAEGQLMRQRAWRIDKDTILDGLR